MRLQLRTIIRSIVFTLGILIIFGSSAFAQKDRVRADASQSSRSNAIPPQREQQSKAKFESAKRMARLQKNAPLGIMAFDGIKFDLPNMCSVYEATIKPKLVAPDYIRFDSIDEFLLASYLYQSLIANDRYQKEFRNKFSKAEDLFFQRARLQPDNKLNSYAQILVMNGIVDKATAKSLVRDAEVKLFGK